VYDTGSLFALYITIPAAYCHCLS